MKTIRNIIWFDYIIQSILLIATFVSIPSIIFPFFGLAAIGLWQMMSALLLGLVLKSKYRLHYFFSAAIYCAIIFGGIEAADYFNWDIPEWFGILYFLTGFVVLPISAAIIYNKFTAKSLQTWTKKVKSESTTANSPIE